MVYIRVSITNKLTELNAIVEELKKNCDNVGGITIFIGVVRKRNFGKHVIKLIYEAQEALANKELIKLTKEIAEKYSLLGAIVEHRVGELDVGDNTMIIALASEHRLNSFLAIMEILDKIKAGIPIWKKEIREDGVVWLKSLEKEGLSVYVNSEKVDVPDSFVKEISELLRKYFGNIDTRNVKIIIG